MSGNRTFDLAAQELRRRHGTDFQIDPPTLNSSILLVMPDDDRDAGPVDVADRYEQYMKEKRATQKVNAPAMPVAKALPKPLPLFVPGDDHCSLEMGDSTPHPASRAYDSATPAKRAMLDAVFAAAETAVVAHKAAREAQAAGLEQYAVQWDMTPKPMPKDRFAAGYGREGMLPMRTLSVLGAGGGIGKTTLMTCLAVSSAVGHPFLGLNTTPGATLFVSAEDGPEEMARKLGAIASQLPADHHEKVMQRVMAVCIPGDKSAAVTERYMRGYEATKMVEQVIAAAKALSERCGLPVRLIVFDHARLIVCGDLNDSEAVSAATRALNHVASETGAAVVMLAHSPKSSLSANRTDEYGAADVLGSGASVDNARFAALMTGLNESERKKFGISPDDAKSLLAFRVIKSNYSEAGRTYYMNKRHVPEWGVMVPDCGRRSERAEFWPVSKC